MFQVGLLQYFWRISETGIQQERGPVAIDRLWSGLPKNLTHVDAVYEVSKN